MNATVLYVGSSLLASLRHAEIEINQRYRLGLRIACHNCMLPFSDWQWAQVERDLAGADIVFVIHVTDTENAARIGAALDRFGPQHRAVIVLNCLGDLMRRTRLRGSDLFRFSGLRTAEESHPARSLVRKLSSWMASYAHNQKKRRPEEYLKFIRQMPAILRFVPSAGKLGDIKQYLTLYTYFLQPTPTNIRSMVLYAIRCYLPGQGKRIKTDPPESRPVAGIYHPDSPDFFQSFDEYRKWYERRTTAPKMNGRRGLDPNRTVGLLLMRPQVVSGACRHYDYLIHALESEGLPVIPVISTFMDNREACEEFLVDHARGLPRVNQVLSLAGFSFVGGPAMNDSKAAVAYLKTLNRPLRSAVSLEVQRVEDWAGSMIGLNPVQTAMQVAIPEIDGATEPLVFGGLPAGKDQPEPLEDRCSRIARRLARWNRLSSLPRADVRLAFLVYCFPPNKGNVGTAADLDVFPSLCDIFRRLAAEGHRITASESPDRLREMLLGANKERSATADQLAGVAYRLSADEYYRLCPYVDEIEAEWGPAPGRIHVQGRDILIQGIELGNVFLGIQPTFGYEGDPMRLLMAKGGTPHHGFMGLYVYLDKVFRADALIHVGTHGALEFMPGKQAGLSNRCWPDRLIGEFPNIYIYSVNNPSEGSIAKRRACAELISYLTPSVANAGTYKELTSLKELLTTYRQTSDERQRENLFGAIEAKAHALHMNHRQAR